MGRRRKQQTRSGLRDAKNRYEANLLADELKKFIPDGTIYLGYPVLASADNRVDVDALLISKAHGIVAFQLPTSMPDVESWPRFIDAQDRLYAVLESNLRRHDALRDGRRLALEIETITVFPSQFLPQPLDATGTFLTLDGLRERIESLSPLTDATFRAVQSAMQRVTTIKPLKKRSSVRHDKSRGALLKIIEREIANLDFWQKKAAIESPDGPQRIRGLAGSGKTVVLALKAAYLHAQNPDWRIAVTFSSRSLYKQFEDLITRFSFEHSNDQPDFDRLRIIHAWGHPAVKAYTAVSRCQWGPFRMTSMQQVPGLDETMPFKERVVNC